MCIIFRNILNQSIDKTTPIISKEVAENVKYKYLLTEFQGSINKNLNWVTLLIHSFSGHLREELF